MVVHTEQSVGSWFLHGLLVAVGAGSLTLGFFLMLPLLQAITRPPDNDRIVREVDTTRIPPQPPPPEPDPPQDEPEPEPPPTMENAPAPNLDDLRQLLNPSFDSGWSTEEIQKRLQGMVQPGSGLDDLASMTGVDQEPRVIQQTAPSMSAKLRKKAPAQVTVIFIVDERGRVENARVEHTTDPLFDRAAINAIGQWRFEPAKRGGEPVPWRMRVTVTFPES